MDKLKTEKLNLHCVLLVHIKRISFIRVVEIRYIGSCAYILARSEWRLIFNQTVSGAADARLMEP